MTLSRSLPSLFRRTGLLSFPTRWKPHPNQKQPLPGGKVAAAPQSDAKAPAVETKEKVRRPMEVPWQPKMANRVHLVGFVGEPIRPVVTAENGALNAVSVLVDRRSTGSDVPHFWIPIIFRGELAQTAIFHVKESDVICVTGELCGTTNAEATHQVIVHAISFVKGVVPKKRKQTTPGKKDHVADQSVGNKEKTTPGKVDGIIGQSFGNKGKTPHKKKGDIASQSETQAKSQKPASSLQSLWNDLINNPREWMDYRMQKQKGLVNSWSPDFKHKNSLEVLWMDVFPEWLSSKIGSLSFAVPDDNVEKISAST